MNTPISLSRRILPDAADRTTPWWFWAVPRIALGLVIAAVAALLWLLHRADLDEQRASLITDVLWVEQDLRFHLVKMEDLLDELGRDALDGRLGAEVFEARVRLTMRQHPWLVQVIWYSGTPEVLAAVPPGIGEFAVGESAGTVPSVETFGFARSLGKPSYSLPYAAVGGDYHVEVHVPQFRGGRLEAMMVGFVSLRALLKDAVPWWYAEKYRLQVLDDNGHAVASKSKVEAGASGVSYAVPFDPPGRGLTLQATAYKSQTTLLRNAIAAAIVVLTAFVLWSLWALRRHVQSRLAAEAALREAHAFRKAMEDSLLTGLRARDLAGRITYVNPAFCRMVGWSEEELVGHSPPMPYWAPEDLPHTREMHDRVLAGNAPREGIELTFVRRDGERFDALIYEAPLIDARGRQTGWMGSVLDISARKRAEELFRQQQEKLQFTSRLVTMGEMASTLAHELNQPLSAIASYNAGCLNKLESGRYTQEELIQVLRKTGTQAQRAGQIIRRIYDFVRRSAPNREPCDLNAIVEDALGLLEADARRRGVRVELELADSLPRVFADRIMIEQVVFNLARNGVEAMQQVAPEQRVLRVASAPADSAVRITVADRGAGIPPELADKLFAPFFTTKEEGMGMGLNICRSITEMHAGRLWFEPNEAGGTVFHLVLPVSAP